MPRAYLAIKSGVVRVQLFAHSRVRQNETSDLHLLTDPDDKAALRKKWLGSETDVGKQLLDATASRRLVNMRHQRPGHTVIRKRTSDEKMVDKTGCLQVCIASDLPFDLGNKGLVGADPICALRCIVFTGCSGLQLVRRVVLAGQLMR